MLRQHVVQAPDLAHARHEDEDRPRIRSIGYVFETDAFKQPDDEVVGDQTLVEEVDSRDSFWRVALLQGDLLLLALFLVIILTRRSLF